MNPIKKSFNFLPLLLLLLSPAADCLTFAESTAKAHEHFGNFNFGVGKGGLGFQGTYEYNYHRTYSVGGFIHMEPKDKDNGIPAVTSISAFIRPHYYQRTWNFYVSPGFGIHMVDSGAKDDTTIGPSLAFGVLYQINDQFALGMENLKLYGWSGDISKGILSDSLFASLQYAF